MSAKAYLDRGVSPTKDDVKKAVAHQSRGLYPGAFCKILPDLAGDPDWCTVVHADGAGTKSSLAYMMYRETGNPGWFAGIAQDSLVMNTDDLACVGATDGFLLSNTIGRNAHRIDAACVAALIRGYDEAIGRMAAQGVGITMTGGETADVGDLIRTLIADSTVVVRFPREQVVDASRIRVGNRIVGLASFGQAVYEDRINSGIGSNGLTAARHLLLSSEYRTRYPESFSETIAPDQVYVGRYSLTTPLPGDDASAGAGMTAGEALLSPTRTYVPVVRDILAACRTSVSGLLHCTGGGQVKCRDFGQGLSYVKDNLFEAPAVFAAIRASGAVDPREMYQIFNMGHRMEVYCDEQSVEQIIAIAASYGIAAQEVGRVESSDGDNQVVIRDRGEEYVF